MDLGVFNRIEMNDAVIKFKKYEDNSLVYTGILKHNLSEIGAFDTKIQKKLLFWKQINPNFIFIEIKYNIFKCYNFNMKVLGKNIEINTEKSEAVYKAIALHDFTLSKILKNKSLDDYSILIVIFRKNLNEGYFYAVEENTLLDFIENLEKKKGKDFWKYSLRLIKKNIIKKFSKEEIKILEEYIKIEDFL